MLEVSNLVKYFGKGTTNEVLALNGLSLSVPEGQFVSIIGSNGAGKSSLLNSLAGAFQLDQGRISLDNQDLTSWPEYKRAGRIGRVFQDPLSGTCANMTIEENLALAMLRGKRRGFGRGVKRHDRALFKERLALLGLGLENRLRDRVGLLSGGQRQALTMLMATLVKPSLLLLDEHTAALDPKTAALILDLTQEIIRTEKLTTLMITHNMHQALDCANRLIMMHQGRIVLDILEDEMRNVSVEDLIRQFGAIADAASLSDRTLLN